MASTAIRHKDKDIQKEFEILYKKIDEIGILKDALRQLKDDFKKMQSNLESKITELTSVIQSMGQQ